MLLKRAQHSSFSLDRDNRTAKVLDGPDFQIIIKVSESTVSAWAGRRGFGIGCEFHRRTLTATGETSAPGYRTALGLAYAWYVDLSLANIDGVPAMLTLASGDWVASKRFIPHSTAFKELILECRNLREPSMAHWVVAHIRHLTMAQPSDEKLATAPDHLKAFMGPGDTWVRGYERSGIYLDRLFRRLKSRALVAEVAGTAYWIR